MMKSSMKPSAFPGRKSEVQHFIEADVAWRRGAFIQLNDWAGWYTLTFKSGKKIRLSRWLSGHLAALDAAGSRNGC